MRRSRPPSGLPPASWRGLIGAQPAGDTLRITHPAARRFPLLAFLAPFITDSIGHYGYVAIFALMLLGSACVPIPSEIVMAFAGALASSTFAERVLGDPSKSLSLVVVIAVGVVASLVGSWIAYWIGYAGGRPLIERWGRYLLLRPHEVDRAHAWFERHGQGAVFFSRMLPLVRAFISLPAGVARMSFGRFTLYTTLGLLPWTIGLALAGRALGNRWTSVEKLIAPISIALAVALLAAAIWWIAKRRSRVSA
jgi:membrane protein DedA with SNARE-associated domain